MPTALYGSACEQSCFDYDNDHLICLGDVCDGWPETKACIDELLKIKNLTYILGNHDYWTLVMDEDRRDQITVWLSQGGDATIKSYQIGVPQQHIQFFNGRIALFLA